MSMTVTEAISEIKSRNKPYAQVGMPQSTFVNTIRNIQAGLAKQNTIIEFMAKFEYTCIKSEEQWVKK